LAGARLALRATVVAFFRADLAAVLARFTAVLARFATVVVRFIMEVFFFGRLFFVGDLRVDDDFFPRAPDDFFPEVLFFAAFLAM
jgi:hypothetical protein